MNIYKIAVDLITKVMNKDFSLKRELKKVYGKYRFTEAEKQRLEDIVLGVIDHYLELDYYLEPYLYKKTKDDVKNLLLIALYLLIYRQENLEIVIEEACKVAVLKNKGVSNFVRRTLRNFSKNKTRDLGNLLDLDRLSIEYSYPLWLVSYLLKDYSYSDVALILKQEETKEKNLTHLAIKQLKLALDAIGLDLWASRESIGFLSDKVKKGKVFAVLEKKKRQRQLESFLKKEKKQNVRLALISPLFIQDEIREESLDFVLINSPSSKLVNYKKEKDLKYKVSLAGIKEIIAIQEAVLEEVAPLLKLNGELCYYTNTVNKDENERVITEFLKNNPSYKLLKEISYDTSRINGYLAYLRKIA
ncbi:MAG TPA: transcription antitermination factor NusB [Bacilli bacterium]|nr:transcription antitermination factor NusB [Bacilli bacterium]HOR53279.1 transcription antitermination factor NusB [Bacilli bacterium]